jgi:hypothetical protein
MKHKDELLEFVVPDWALPSLINGDDSGLNDEDIDKIDKFVSKTSEKYGNANFMLPSEEEMDLGFRRSNDIDNLGNDCSLLYLRPTKKYESGSEIYNEDDEEENEETERIQELADEYNIPTEVVVEYLEYMGVDAEDIRDLNYYGTYSSQSDFAEQLVDEGVITDVDRYLYMTETDMRILAGEEADNRVDDMDDEDVLREVDGDYDMETIDDAREELKSTYYDEIYDELDRDAVGYFVNNFGYSESDLIKNRAFRVDYDKLGFDLEHDYIYINHDGDTYVFNNYARGGMMAKGGGIPKSYTHFIVYKPTDKIMFGYDYKGVDADDIKYYTKQDFKDMDFDDVNYKLISKERLIAKGIDPFDKSNWSNYADGGMMAKGGEFGVDKHRIYFSTLGELIDFIHDIANENGYEVVDIFPNLTYGGIGYGQTKRVKVELEWNGREKIGKSKKREKNTLVVSIYRMDSGNYELNSYFAYADGGETQGKVYEKVKVTIRDVDMGGDVIYKGDHWLKKDRLDTMTNEEVGNYILKKYLLDYGNTYKYSIKRTGETRTKMARGGVTFDDKVKSISESLFKRKKVSPSVQKDYGKTYSKKEAIESAKRIAGAMRKKETSKKKR